MYLERTGNYLKIMEEIGNLLIEGQTENLWINETLSVSIVKKRDILNLNAERSLRTELIIETLGF